LPRPASKRSLSAMATLECHDCPNKRLRVARAECVRIAHTAASLTEGSDPCTPVHREAWSRKRSACEHPLLSWDGSQSADTEATSASASPYSSNSSEAPDDGMHEAREQEMAFLLSQSQHGSSSLGSTVARRRMRPDEVQRIRDVGLAILVMASKSFDVSPRTFVLAVAIFDKHLKATIAIEMPDEPRPDTAASSRRHPNFELSLACFMMACKFVETFAPRLTDLVGVVEHRCSVSDVKDAEMTVLGALGWDIGLVTGLDILHKLLSYAPPRRAAQIKADAELSMQVAYCNRELSTHAPGVLAVGVLLNACDQSELDEDFLDFVPGFMLTPTARALSDELKAFVAEHVRPRVDVA
jgi:hypothetical protein